MAADNDTCEKLPFILDGTFFKIFKNDEAKLLQIALTA